MASNGETRELIKVLNEHNIKSQDRMEAVLNKISAAMVTLNHNSTATVDAINEMKTTIEAVNKSQKDTKSKLTEISRNIAYILIIIGGAKFALGM